MKTSTHHSSVHLNSNVLIDRDVWMPKVLMSTKYLRESLTNLSDLRKLTEIEPKSTNRSTKGGSKMMAMIERNQGIRMGF